MRAPSFVFLCPSRIHTIKKQLLQVGHVKRQKEKSCAMSISYTGRAITLWASGRKQKNGEIMQRGQVVLNQLSNLFFFLCSSVRLYRTHETKPRAEKRGTPVFHHFCVFIFYERERDKTGNIRQFYGQHIQRRSRRQKQMKRFLTRNSSRRH